MLNLKKTAVAVLALTSSAVFAGTMGPVCTPGNVTVPCESTAWDIGGYALYMQPVYDANLGYNAITANANVPVALAVPRVDLRIHDSNLDWGWGFKLEGSYHFNTGNDLNVNWYHLDTTTNHNIRQIVNTVDNFRWNTKWDAVNGEFGQHIDVSEAYKLRLHGGVQYARINSQARHHFPAGNVTGIFDMDFNGFGPRAGMDTTYMLGNGFSVYGNAATALLIGTSKFNDALRVGANNATLLAVHGSKTAMVPMLEGKLGVKYNWSMAQGDFILDAGYQWVNYFQANHVAPVVESNFAVDGVVFGAKWIGRV